MSEAAVSYELFSLRERVLKAFGLVHSENRGELLVRELLAQVNRLNLADEDFSRFRNLDSRELRDSVRRLSDDLGVESAVDDDSLSDLVDLVVLKDVTASLFKFVFNVVVNILVNDNALLGGADHTVIEGLGVDNRVDREQYIGALVDDGGSVAGAYA